MNLNHKTSVRFLEDPDTKTVFAYFPYDIYSPAGDLRSSYSHVGQHSACSQGYAKQCQEALPEQYKELKEELEGIGYNLRVLNKQMTE